MDIQRIKSKKFGRIFKPLYLKKYTPLKDVFDIGKLASDSEFLVFEIGSKHLAFSKQKMAFHHIAQGYVNESPYMLTFCVICNSGMIMNPVVNNNMLQFYIAGSYNGMLLMADKETESYWDHITGMCLEGKHKGKQLDILHSHQILTLKEALEHYPDCLYGKEEMDFFQSIFSKFQNYKARINGGGFLPPGFRKSMLKIDDRLPEMEMGLGVWEKNKAMFYPIKAIKENGNFLLNKFNNDQLLIYISPTTATPSAIYVENCVGIKFDKDKITFANGNYILGGNLYYSKNMKIASTSPNHIFLRWYGFVSTFSNCEIYSSSI